VPNQESGGDREYEGQQNRPIWGDRTGCVYLTAQWRSVSTGMQGWTFLGQNVSGSLNRYMPCPVGNASPAVRKLMRES
jgi:hypothetical protein